MTDFVVLSPGEVDALRRDAERWRKWRGMAGQFFVNLIHPREPGEPSYVLLTYADGEAIPPSLVDEAIDRWEDL